MNHDMMDKEAAAKLVEAATLLFATKGYAAVTVRELAEAAQVNSALISYYFGGKEKLYSTVLETQLAAIGEVVDHLTQQARSPRERLRQYAGKVAVVHRKCPYLFRLLSGELTTPTPFLGTVVKQRITRVFGFLRQTIMDGIELGEFRPDLDPDYAAVGFAGMLNFYFIVRPLAQQLLTPRDRQDEQYLLHAVDAYLNGVVKHDE